MYLNYWKLKIQRILEQPYNYEWTVQGLGMFRTYLDEDHRLRIHIWNSLYKTPNVSTIHSHPWDFTSYVIAGKIKNIQYKYVKDMELSYQPQLGCVQLTEQTIACGEEGGLVGTPKDVSMYTSGTTTHTPVNSGSSYYQKAEEIHETVPLDGTVTLIKREFKKDREHAKVFWPLGEEWGDAKPRKATKQEIKEVTEQSLRRWFYTNEETH